MISKFEFTNSEFILLSLIIGARKITVLADQENICAMAEAALADKWGQVKGRLMNRGYLVEEESDVLLINVDLLALMNSYAKANKIVLIEVMQMGVASVRELFCCSNTGVCELSLAPENPHLSAFIPENETAIMEFIEQHVYAFTQTDSRDPAGANAVLNRSQYFEFMAAMNMDNTPKVAQLLLAGGMDEGTAQDAAKGFWKKEKLLTVSLTELAEKDSMNEILPKIFMFYFGQVYIYQIIVSENDTEAFIIKALTKDQTISGIKETINLN